MEQKINLHWDKCREKLICDKQYACQCAEKILRDILGQKIDIERITVKLPKKDNELLLMEMTVDEGGIKRNMKLIICRELKENPMILTLCYYCVEAPAILIESGSAEIRLGIDSDVLVHAL